MDCYYDCFIVAIIDCVIADDHPPHVSHGASFYCYGYVSRAMVVAASSLATNFAAVAYIDGSFVPLQVDIEFNVFWDSCFRTC